MVSAGASSLYSEIINKTLSWLEQHPIEWEIYGTIHEILFMCEQANQTCRAS